MAAELKRSGLKTWQAALMAGVAALIGVAISWHLTPKNLVYPDAYHYAELGRQFYRGEGFTSLQVYPYILSWFETHGVPLTPPWPNVARFPLMTILHAGSFSLLGPSVEGIFLTGVAGFVLLVVLVAILGSKLYSPGVGLVAGLSICAHTWLVALAFSGLLETWAATFIAAVALALLSAHRSLARAVLLGLLLGLSFLLRYDLLVLVPAAMAAVVFFRREDLGRTLAGIVMGFSAMVLPWVARNLVVTGDPVAMLSIDRNLFRATELGVDPYAKSAPAPFVDQLLANFEMIVGKFSAVIYPFERPELFAGEGNLWVAVAALLSILWIGLRQRRELWVFLLTSYSLRILLLSAMHHERRFYSSFVPLVILVGLGGLWSLWDEKIRPRIERRSNGSAVVWWRWLAVPVVLLACGYLWKDLGGVPTLVRIHQQFPAAPIPGAGALDSKLEVLVAALPKSGVVATTQSERIAWYGDLPAIEVSASAQLRDLLEGDLPIEALYYPESASPWLLYFGAPRFFLPGEPLPDKMRVWSRRTQSGNGPSPASRAVADPLSKLPVNSPSPDADGVPRLAVLYIPCTVNASRLAPYDKDAFYTPQLAQFAEQAKVFERHQTESGQSGIAYASILSGAQADHHGIFAHPRKIRQEVELLSESFAKAGWDVHAFTTQGMEAPRLGYWQGVPRPNRHRRPLPTGKDERVGKILDRVVEDPDYRALVVVSYTASHWPYRNLLDEMREHHPAEMEVGLDGLSAEDIAWAHRIYFAPGLRMDFSNTRDRLELDDAEIAKLARVMDWIYASNLRTVDELFGGMVEAIDERGLGPESVIVFTADHGEVLYRDNAEFVWSHGFQLAPEVLRVPLLIRGPGIEPGRVASVTRSIDLVPTLGGLLDVPVATEVSGTDLSRALKGAEDFPERLLAFSHTSMVRDDKVAKAQANWERFARLHPNSAVEGIWVSVRDHDMVFRWRHAGDGRFLAEAFDLASDPEQRNNLFNPDDPLHATRLDQLHDYKARLVSAFHGAAVPVAPVDDRQIEQLRALGYVE